MKKDSGKTRIEPAYIYLGVNKNENNLNPYVLQQKYNEPEQVKMESWELYSQISKNSIQKPEKNNIVTKGNNNYPERIDVFELFLDMSNELLLTKAVNKIDDLDLEVLKLIISEEKKDS